MLVAVTGSDEINMIACQIAHSIYRTPTKFVVFEPTAMPITGHLFCDDAIPVDMIISPEKLVTPNILSDY